MSNIVEKQNHAINLKKNANLRLYKKSWKQNVVSVWKIFCIDSRNQMSLLQKLWHTRGTEAWSLIIQCCFLNEKSSIWKENRDGKKGAFSAFFFFMICVLTQCIAYRINFQNIHAFFISKNFYKQRQAEIDEKSSKC